MKNLLLAISLLLMVVWVSQSFAEDSFSSAKHYGAAWQDNAPIPKSYGHLVHIDPEYMVFEADDGTIRMVSFKIFDATQGTYRTHPKIIEIKRN